MRTFLLTASLVACAYGLPSSRPATLLNSRSNNNNDDEGTETAGGGGMVSFNLTHLEEGLFKHEIQETLNTDVQEDCNATDKKTYVITDIHQSEQKVGASSSTYRLHCTVETGGGEAEMIVLLTTFESDTGIDPEMFQISKMTPYDFLPQCAKDMIEEEQAAGQQTTLPSNADEASTQAAEQHEHMPHAGTTNGTAALRDAAAKKTAAWAKTTPGDRKGMRERYHLGYVPEKIYPLHAVKRDKTALKLQGRPATYDPFIGTADETCLTNFPARNQGSCGSCYAFAATTAMSLQYCLKMNAGSRQNPTLVFSPQTLVSCGGSIDMSETVLVDYYNDDYENSQAYMNYAGSDSPYNGGCNGGSGVKSFMYMKRFGYPFTVCYPYASGGGDPLTHFDAAQGQDPTCHDTCTGASTAGDTMTTFSAVTWTESLSTESVGIDVCKGENSIMDCMLRDGPMFCAFQVYSDFGDFGTWSQNGPYDGPATGATVSGGHAVTCYGWGVEDDGTPYWKCINSWGGWWGANNRGEFKIKKGSDVANFESWGCVVATLDASQITGMPPYPPDPPATPPPPSPLSPPAPPPPSPPKDCGSCSNGNGGGRCLMLIPSSECPSVYYSTGGVAPISNIKLCAAADLEPYELCRANYASHSAYNTDSNADNCNEAQTGYDVYRSVDCYAPPALPPSPSPPPSSPAVCADTRYFCSAGYEWYCTGSGYGWFPRACPVFCNSCEAACSNEATMCLSLNGDNSCEALTPANAALYGQDFCTHSCVSGSCPHSCGGNTACPGTATATTAFATTTAAAALNAAAAPSQQNIKEQFEEYKLRVSAEVQPKVLRCEESCAQSGLVRDPVQLCEMNQCKDCKVCN